MHNMKRPAQAPFGPPAIARELLLVWPARHQRLPSSQHLGTPATVMATPGQGHPDVRDP